MHLRCVFAQLLAALVLVFLTFAGVFSARAQAPDEATVRTLLVRSILTEGDEQAKALIDLADTGSTLVSTVLTAWRQGELFIENAPDGARIPFTRSTGAGIRVDNGQPVESAVTKAEQTTSKVRKAIKNTLDFLAMADPSPQVRVSSISKMGMLQNVEYLPVFRKRLETEKNDKVRKSLEEAVAITLLKDESPDVRIAAIEKLAALRSIPALDMLKAIATAEPEPEEPAAEAAAEEPAAVPEAETATESEAPDEMEIEATPAAEPEATETPASADSAADTPVPEATVEEVQPAPEAEETATPETPEEAAAAAKSTANEARVKASAVKAVAVIEHYLKYVEVGGTLFRGLSAGSVLLVVALGLAITFGLMGVINMAHGEIMAVGAYTTYVMQNIFASGINLTLFGLGVNIPGLNLTGSAADSYFLWALPAAFLMAALTGIALERGVIRFLYRRPLESLLATWGISLVLQQFFRLVFGANNVQVSSPSWLSGNFTVSDVTLGWNRLFVIGFAVFIVILTWLLLTRTRLGLLIRAVMQNRQMAACMGVRTERVNMMTFGFGSGLAGLAGAFLSQISNVGPGLGKTYIVDSFMTVVTGGLGNLIGTVCSALGIGLADQALQSTLDPVMGKVIVLAVVILFLLWKPGGFFPTRSRSLDG